MRTIRGAGHHLQSSVFRIANVAILVRSKALNTYSEAQLVCLGVLSSKVVHGLRFRRLIGVLKPLQPLVDRAYGNPESSCNRSHFLAVLKSLNDVFSTVKNRRGHSYAGCLFQRS